MLPQQKLNAFERFTKTSVWPAYIGCIWAFIYAVFIRFYQAAGGLIGISGQLKNPTEFYIVSYIAGLIILLCGFILIVLIKPWGRIIPKQIPLIGSKKIHRLFILIPTLLCTAFLIAHGASGIITSALHLMGIISLDNFSGFVKVDADKMAIWNLFIYEPWFLIMGILSGLTAAHYAQASGVSLSTFRRSTITYLIIVFLLTTLFLFAIIFDFVEAISF
ncbi:DUF3995 domain-containing protein [Bacillus cereus]|nr:DUF3995 domain-containing protein [Bacillus cereus]